MKGGAGGDRYTVGAGDAVKEASGAGNDPCMVDNAGDRIGEVAGGGQDQVMTALAAHTLDANVETLASTRASGQALSGNADANVILGGNGGDTLSGMGGDDTLTGGAGADRFDFRAPPGADIVDLITDFTGLDTIRRENSGAGLFAGLANGALAASAFKVIGAGVAVDASDRILYNQTSGTLYFDADGSGAVARIKFAEVLPGTILSASDFLVI